MKYVFATKERIDLYSGFKAQLNIDPNRLIDESTTYENLLIRNNMFRRGGAMRMLEGGLNKLCGATNYYLSSIIRNDSVTALKLGLVNEDYYKNNKFV